MTVTGCDDCPLLSDHWCTHPGPGVVAAEWVTPLGGEREAPPPGWCPLRKGPLTIALEGGPPEEDACPAMVMESLL